MIALNAFEQHFLKLEKRLNTLYANKLSGNSLTPGRFKWNFGYHQVSNISRTLVGNKNVDHSDVVGASPVGAAPTISSFST